MPFVETIAVISVPDCESHTKDKRIEVCRVTDRRVVMHVKGEGGDTATIYMDRAHAITLLQQIAQAIRD